MPRREFTKEIKRAALRRSGKKCEAIGPDYGLATGMRCFGELSAGVEFDHVVPDQLGGDTSLENCAAVCRTCHRYKTDRVDSNRIARAKRRADLKDGIRTASRMPAARNSPWKQKIGGGWVRRDEEHA